MTDNAKTFTLVQAKPNQSAIEEAGLLLEKCKSGEVKAFTYMAEMGGSQYMIGASYVQDRHKSAGILLEAAMARIGSEE